LEDGTHLETGTKGTLNRGRERGSYYLIEEKNKRLTGEKTYSGGALVSGLLVREEILIYGWKKKSP